MRSIIILLILLAALSLAACAEKLRIATWNIENLRANNNVGPNKRNSADYDRLKNYAEILDADIIALQEVEGENAARRIFDPDKYKFFFSTGDNAELTGFAVRKNLRVSQNPDYDELNTSGGLSLGTDINLIVEGHLVRLLSVHLMSGCWGDDLDTQSDACRKLKEQLPVLEQWINDRAASNTPFIILGDFNRRLDIPNDEFWEEIDDAQSTNADLTSVTKGHTSACWGGEFTDYIDHIVFDLLSAKWIVADSFGQLIYTENPSLKKKLSDHCPLYVDLKIDAGPVSPVLSNAQPVTSVVTKSDICNKVHKKAKNFNSTLWMETSTEYKGNSLQAYKLAEIQTDKGYNNPSWTAAIEQGIHLFSVQDVPNKILEP